MRGLFTGLVFLIPMVLVGQSDAKEAIEEVLRDQVTAWNDGDIEGYMEGYWKSGETMFVSGGSVLMGHEEVLQRYKKTYGTREKMGTLTFDGLRIRMLTGTAAIATGRWELQRSADKPWGRFSLLFEKKPEGWRIVYDHTSLGTD